MHPPAGNVTIVFALAGDGSGAVPGAAGGGYEVKQVEGGVMLAFPDAGGAVAWSLAAQRAGALRVGIHSGEPICVPDPRSGRMDYFGPVVNLASRLAAAGHPGQTLLSAAAARPLLQHAGFVDLGDHRLRGLEKPEQVFLALPPGGDARAFPPLRALTTLPTNLPTQTASFVGREPELKALDGLLADPAARVVVLTGPAGTGKTRLAVRTGAEHLERFPGGVWFADLSEAADAGAVGAVVAAALGLPGGGHADPVGEVGDALENRRPLLLILDTFERAVAHAGATVGFWAAQAPHARFLLTSRARTGLPGERELVLEPLPVAPAAASAAEALRSDAVRLFVERAAEARPGFALTDANVRDVAAICADLEGIPLAIELAASRARILQPAELLRKLGQKFQLLRSARQDAARRQQTLSGAIEWSYEMLAGWERAAFRQASVFRGGFTPAAAAAVIDLAGEPGEPPGDAAAESLCGKSLLRGFETAAGRRYGFYRPLHEFAERKLAEADGDAGARAAEARHEAYYLEMADGLERAGSRFADTHDRIHPDLENFFAIQDRGLARGGEGVIAAALAATATVHAVSWRGPLAEGAARLERALQALEADPALPGKAPPLLRATLYYGLGRVHRALGDWERSEKEGRRAVELASPLGRSGFYADTLWELAFILGSQGKSREHRAVLDECEEVSRELGLKSRLVNVLHLKTVRLMSELDSAGAIAIGEEALALARETGREDALAGALNALGNTLYDAGFVARSESCYRQAIEIDERQKNLSGLATKLGNLGDVLSLRGDPAGALECFRRAAAIDRDLGRRMNVAFGAMREATALRRAGDFEGSLRAYAGAEAIFRAAGNRPMIESLERSRARLLLLQGDFAAALRGLEVAGEILREEGEWLNFSEVAALRARTLLAAGRAAESRESIRAVLAEPWADRAASIYRFAWYAILAQAEEALGDAGAAREAAAKACALADVLLPELTPKNEDMRDLFPAARRIAGKA
ncbi:MAG: tetratricopeptide repeat protein [Planctomycetes bacterium]|nr:tetratricopeptide repeat protein [Planctomycetota bacterium]